MNWQVFQNLYNINTNFLIYQGVISVNEIYMKCLDIKCNQVCKLNGPITLKVYFKSTQGSTDFLECPYF